MGRILAICLLLLPGQVGDEYPLRRGKPTTKGIVRYVDEQGLRIIREYQEFMDDSLHDVGIVALEPDQIESTHPMEMGHYFPHEAYITTAEAYEAYEVDQLKPERRRKLKESNRFVKGIIIHELTHAYIFLIATEMRSLDSLGIHPSYPTGALALGPGISYGSVFIEEGLCEYVTEKMGELIPPDASYRPTHMEEMLSGDNTYRIQYKYASQFLAPFLDTMNFKSAVKILLYNPPPSLEEIMKPELFYERILVPRFLEK
jgi:hypothetical protein